MVCRRAAALVVIAFFATSLASLAGGSVDAVKLLGRNGHLDAFAAIGQGADEITAFLAK